MIERTSETALLFVGETGKTGLHARTAAHLIRWTAGLDALLSVAAGEKKRLAFTCNPPSPGNFYRLCAMGVRPGQRLEISAEGPDAPVAIDRAFRALEEEPPSLGADLEELRAWDGRVRDGMPSVDSELDSELRWAIDMSAVETLTAAQRSELDARIADQVLKAIRNDGRTLPMRDRWRFTNKRAERVRVLVPPHAGRPGVGFELDPGDSSTFDAEPDAWVLVGLPSSVSFTTLSEVLESTKVRKICEKDPGPDPAPDSPMAERL